MKTIKLAGPLTLNQVYKALLPVGLALLGAVITYLKSGPLTSHESVSLFILAVTGVGTFFVPLLDTKWQSILKTGVAVLGAAAVALNTFLPGHVTGSDWLIVVFAGLNVLGGGIIPIPNPALSVQAD